MFECSFADPFGSSAPITSSLVGPREPGVLLCFQMILFTLIALVLTSATVSGTVGPNQSFRPLFAISFSASILSYECISVYENVRLTRLEESVIADSLTLLQCHQKCRERGYDTCSVYVFDSEQEICKMYTEGSAKRGEREEEVLWNTLVELKPDCFDNNLIGKEPYQY